MNVCKVITIFFFVFFSEVGCKSKQVHQDSIEIRVVNNSDKAVTRVSMFSMGFGDLQPNESSEYKVLEYEPLSDDSLIYCIYDDTNYARYLQMPDKGAGHYTYSIDSLKNRIIYISMKLD